MISQKVATPVLGALAVSVAVAVWLVPATRTAASNHIDSPISTQDRGANITDQYAFLDPSDNSKVVLIMGTQGFIIPGEHFGMSIFDPHLRYRWMISNSGNPRPDENIDVTYAPGVGRLTAQTATIVLPNGAHYTAQTTIATQLPAPNAPVITTDPATGVKFFAGGHRARITRLDAQGFRRQGWLRGGDATPIRSNGGG